jgi:type II secretion system (T2SS) protein E
MRHQLGTAAAFLEEEDQQRLPEFGTGLRARLEVVKLFSPAPALEYSTAQRDVSPELMLVSPPTDDPGSVLAELMARRVRDVRHEPLGTLLAEAGLLDEAELDYALSTARKAGKRLGEVLVEHGLVTSVDVVRLVAEQRGLPFLDVATLSIDPAAARLLPADQARTFKTLPIGFVRGLPVLALSDPSDEEAIDGARSILRGAEFVASPEAAILEQFARVYFRAPLYAV